LEVHGLRDAVDKVKAAGKRCVVATPRILKPDEQRLWSFYLRLRADGLLIRSTGFLQQMADLGGAGAFVPSANCSVPSLIGDFSLNPSNSITADFLLDCGLSRITPTHDLNAVQIENLAKNFEHERRGQIEVIAHQHLPIFHTEHCVFCRFLSSGNSYKDCGHPCETNRVHLRGMDGADHVVLADQGCRNTVFNAKAQSAALYMDGMLAAGIRRFRIELVDEPASVVRPLLEKYRSVCRHEEGAVKTLLDWLDEVPDGNGRFQGSTAGSLKPTAELSRDRLKQTAYQKSK
jgi:collagenase-like PrtC family protease